MDIQKLLRYCLATVFFLLACNSQSADSKSSIDGTNHTQETQEESQEIPRVIVVGDSLTAGLGLPADSIYTAIVSEKLKSEGFPTELLNAGVSGDTTAGGLRRLEWLLKQQPDLVIIELGGNDGLRGMPLQEIEGNLAAMIEVVQQADTEVMLMQMQVPSNFGSDYTDGFTAIYPRLADKYQITLMPFLLEGVAGDKALNQADGIHPTKEGHARMADSFYEHLELWRKAWTP